MAFPNGLTVDGSGQKDDWWLVAIVPTCEEFVSWAYVTSQIMYRISMARKFGRMTAIATQNGVVVTEADVNSLNAGPTGLKTSPTTALTAGWTGIVTGDVYIDAHGVSMGAAKANAGEETLDLVWAGPVEQINILSLPNPSDTLPESLTAASVDDWAFVSLTPTVERNYNWADDLTRTFTTFKMTLTRKFARLTSFTTNCGLAVKTTGMPTMYSAEGLVTTANYASLIVGTDTFRRLVVEDDGVQIDDPVSGAGTQTMVLTSIGAIVES